MVGFVPHIRGSALLLDSCPSLVVAMFVVLLILRVRRVSHWPLCQVELESGKMLTLGLLFEASNE